jgi:hypothetical protein
MDDIEHLVVVVEAVIRTRKDWGLYSFGWVKELVDALAYWMEEKR